MPVGRCSRPSDHVAIPQLIGVGFFAPAGTPTSIVRRLNRELNEVAKSSEVVQVITLAPVAAKLTENLSQSVVVDNKAGAGDNVAAQHIAMAAPDGYTIHLTSVGPMSVAPHLVKDLAYDPKRDIAPITMGVVFSNVMVVHTDVPAKTLDEFVTLAR